MIGGEQLFDLLGTGFTLVDSSGQGTGAPLVKEAQAHGVPLAHLPTEDGAVRASWERDLVLVRPDQHVAWRGDDEPEEPRGLIDLVRGAGKKSAGKVAA